MSFISFSNVYRSYGSQVVLDGATFSIDRGDRVGLIGRNGVGKSTILRLITGVERPERGQVIVQPRIRIGEVTQDPNLDFSQTVFQAVLGGRPELVRMEAELRQLEQLLGAPEADHNAVLEQYGELQHEFDRLGGHEFHGKAAAVLAGLGLPLDTHDRPVEVLSGGQKTRLALARLLLSDPDLLLLDEPTNHLDLEATEWLQEFLQRSQATQLMVSHDRYLLDAVCDHVIEVENCRTDSYSGNYSAFLVQKTERLEREKELYERQQQKIQKLESYIRRYKEGNRATMAKSREKALARLEPMDRPRDARAARVQLGSATRSGRDVVRATRVEKRFDRLVLFRNLDLVIERGERIGLVGPNGAGKTTLIRLILGQEQPTEGSITVGTNVHIGYFSQSFQGLSGNRTIIEEIMADSDLDIPRARSLLARFLFTDEEVFKEVGDLSGGERNRVALCKLLLTRPNFLVLDEPTNHLDIATREGLVKSLEEFNGTLLVASHDRYLLDRITNRTLEIADGQARLYPGSYSEYRRERLGAAEPALRAVGKAAVSKAAVGAGAARHPGGGRKGAAAPSARTGSPAGSTAARKPGGASHVPGSVTRAAASASRSPAAIFRPQGSGSQVPVRPQTSERPPSVPRLERQIQEMESRLAGLTERMNDPDLYKSPDMLTVVEDYDRVRIRLDKLYEEWEAIAG